MVPWVGDTSSVSSGDGMLYVGRWASYEARKAEAVAWRSTPLLILMGKKSEKHFRETELFLLLGFRRGPADFR